MRPKFIVITGGVLSGLGKGLATASIGKLLSSRLKIIPLKLDGYLNTDPGTINPLEHGEVFILDDGGEVDMDFGHYERFLDISCKSNWNLTMGKIFQEIWRKERKGEYLGKTVQYIPHVVDLIKEKLFQVVQEEKADLVLVEVGGTVGDIENELYIEAVRQLKKEVGAENICYIHLTYIPLLPTVKEQKSKPTQQSVNLLRQRGIQPDIIIGRCTQFLDKKIKEKIACFCDVEERAVISGIDVNILYEIPFIFEKEGLVEIIHQKLHLYSPPQLEEWRNLITNLQKPQGEIDIAICGKYTQLEDSYASLIEALKHCSAHTRYQINLRWIETEAIEEGKINLKNALEKVQGIIVPGGFGQRGTEGKIEVIKYARENKIPFLGICFGLQLAVVEYARNVGGLKEAHSTEINPQTPHPIVDLLPEQKKVQNKGGTMRLGAYPAVLEKGCLVQQLYQKTLVYERHRHRYEVNPRYQSFLQEKGLVLSGFSPDKKLVEFIELKEHPYFVATQAHPELKSKLTQPSPLFYGLVKAAIKQKEN